MVPTIIFRWWLFDAELLRSRVIVPVRDEEPLPRMWVGVDVRERERVALRTVVVVEEEKGGKGWGEG